MNRAVKTLVFWLVIAACGFLLWHVTASNPKPQREREIAYSAFLSQVEGGNIRGLTISGRDIDGAFTDGELFHVVGPAGQDGLISILHANNVQFSFSEANQGWRGNLLNLAPLLLLAAIWFFMLRKIKQKQSSTS